MSIKKNIGEEEIKKQKPFNQSEEVEAEYLKHWVKFNDYRTDRDQTIRFFNKNGVDRNIIDYVKDSVDRMNEFHSKPGWKEDWNSNVFDPITRNKLISILSKIASSRMKPELIVKPKSIFNSKNIQERKLIYSDLLEAANRKNKDQLQLIWEMYTAMSEGTVIGYESWLKDTHEVEYIKEVDPDTGEVKSEKIKVDAWDDVFGKIVPINQWYPRTIWVHDIGQVKKCFMTDIMSLEDFKETYGKFKNAQHVNSAGYYMNDESFEWGLMDNMKGHEVFVLQFFDEVNDRLKIWANGTEIYNGPMPWNHKKLPFWLSIFEPIHHQFLYGKSLPDKLMGMQDVDNALFNGMLDQLFIGLNSPIFAAGEIDDIGDNYLEPGRIYHGEEGSSMSKMNLGQLDANTFNMLSLVKRGMEESSISAQAQGVATGGRKTRYEVQQLQEGALSLASLFLQIMESCYSQKYYLRLHNILQYYSQPSSVESGKLKFKFLVLEDRKLTNGKTGKKMIQITNEIPTDAMAQLTKTAEQESGQEFNPLESKVEPIILTTDYLRNDDIDMEIIITPNSSIKQTEADQKNAAIAFFQMTAQDPYIDPIGNRKALVNSFDMSEELVKEPQPQGAQDPMQGLPDMGQPQAQGQEQTPLL